MSTGTPVKGSTQDNSNGVPVAQATNERPGGGPIQDVSIAHNKSTYTPGVRTTITAADAGNDISDGSGKFGETDRFALYNAGEIVITAHCDTPSATLQGFMIFYKPNGDPVTKSGSITLTADANKRNGTGSGYYIADYNVMPCKGMLEAKFYITSVSAGSWDVEFQPV